MMRGGGGETERIGESIWSREVAILYLRPSAPWFHDICSIPYARSWQPLSLASFPRRQPIIFPNHEPIVQGCPHPASSAPCRRPWPLSLSIIRLRTASPSSSPSTMTTLPSFVELMASLGLGGPDDAPEPAKLSVHHSRSSSHSSSASAFSAASSSNVPSPSSNIYPGQQHQLQHKHSSPAIVVSSHEGSPERDIPQDIRRSRATTRYSPYGPIVSTSLLCGVPRMESHTKQNHSRKASMPTLNAERTLERPTRVSTLFVGRICCIVP